MKLRPLFAAGVAIVQAACNTPRYELLLDASSDSAPTAMTDAQPAADVSSARPDASSTPRPEREAGVTGADAPPNQEAGSIVWSIPLSSYARPRLVPGDGSLYLIGSIRDEWSLGGITLRAPAGSAHAFVAQLNEDGAVRWARSFGGTGIASFWAAAAADGGLLVAGQLPGTVQIDQVSFYPIDENAYVLVKLDDGGTVVWASPLPAAVNAIIVDPIVPTPNGYRVFLGENLLVSYSKNGVRVTGGDTTLMLPMNFRVKASHPAGGFVGEGYIAAGDMLAGRPYTGEDGQYVARVGESGSVMWGTVFQMTSGSVNAIAADARGDVFASGRFNALILDGKRYDEPGAFLLKASATDGKLLWSKVLLAGSGNHEATGLRVDGETILWSAKTQAAANLGGSDLPLGVFLARFASEGRHVWSRALDERYIPFMLVTPSSVFAVGAQLTRLRP